MTREMFELKDRWLTLCTQVGHKGDIHPPLNDLITWYSEPWRAYHTLDHVLAMLREMDGIYHLLFHFKIPEEVMKLAIWYHDAVYNPRKKDNEEQSTELFRKFKLRCTLPLNQCEKVVRMILDSKHKSISSHIDSQIFCDIDLSILGQPGVVFDEYERQIRKEYEWVPEQDYIRGRVAILQSFLDRQHVYSTEFFREKYEERARKNLTRSIVVLTRRLQS